MALQIASHESFCQHPAQSVLKTLQVFCLSQKLFGGENFKKEISKKARILLQECQDLKEEAFYKKDVSRLMSNELLCDHMTEISSELTQDALLKLSLLAQHFDSNGSVSEELRQFIAEPQAMFHRICKFIWSQYNDQSNNWVLLEDFEQEMVRLLTFLETAFTTRRNVIFVEAEYSASYTD
ncbi:uncharacterized protein BO97DRAFT_401623 [Aspergillus homomorphus CBS 101889]|uniref:Uncharacterized protein n=1 Tax=Aspergillus homomorphus (strain CBS 101889) TaxID=1450537 RepID=A0A395HFF7_ASPHC|nr:hypothetical protein BO97DRAFT_401623 [Aspergillus homomorphus CBS 101889]RAL06632.1 hypothetical protein BO97DRAFT_401623 [Aspergillus homomorphus CBS 101889]